MYGRNPRSLTGKQLPGCIPLVGLSQLPGVDLECLYAHRSQLTYEGFIKILLCENE
jgi:hypothetical protein